MIPCGICLEEYQEGELELHREMCVVRLMFRCSLCSVDFMSKDGLWNHLDLHEIADESKELHYQEIRAKQKLLQCALCNDQRAYSESFFWKHVHDTHDGFFLKCSDCGENFRSEKLKNDHTFNYCKAKDQTVTSDYGDREKDLVPNDVKEMTSDGEHLKSLQSSTANERLDRLTLSTDTELSQCPRVDLNTDNDTDNNCSKKDTESLPGTSEDKDLQSQFACDICGIKYPSVNRVRYHKRIKHDWKHKCPHCRRVFQIEEYQTHLSLCEKKQFSCALCHSKFQTSAYLAKHVRIVHRDKDTLENEQRDQNSSSETKCRYCDKQYSSATSLRQHISLSHKPITCDICGITLNGTDKAHYHKIMKHMEPRYECAKCLKKFRWRKHYTFHSNKCAGVKRNLSSHKCSHCGKKLSSAAILARHVLTHHEPAPCDICGITLSSLFRALRHQFPNVQIGQQQNQGQNIDLKMEITVEETTISTHDGQRQSTLDAAGLEKTITRSKIHGEIDSSIHEGMNCTEELKKSSIEKPEKSSTGSSGEKSALQSRVLNSSDHSMCNICGISFSGYPQAYYHKITRHTEAKFQCPHCSKKYNDAIRFKAHTPVCAGRKISCELCDKKLKTLPSLKQHMRRTHASKSVSNGTVEGTSRTVEKKQNSVDNSTLQPPGVGRSSKSSSTKCPYCEKEYSRADFLPGHIKKFHVTESLPDKGKGNDLLSRCACDICGMTYSSSGGVRHHKRKVHDWNHKCPHCQRIFHMEEYQAHLPLCEKKKFSCALCQMKFRTRKYLSKHMRKVHRGQGTWENDTNCHYCDKPYYNAINLREHISKTHKPFKCGICGITMIGSKKANYHKIMKHMEPKYECPKCLKKFHLRNHYTYHSNVCAGVVSGHKCSHCGKNLASAALLARHVLIYHEPVACDICGITFSSHHRALRHQNMMHKETKYKCPYCSMLIFGRLRFQGHVSRCESKNVPCEFCGRTFKNLRAAKKHTLLYCRANKASKKVRYGRMSNEQGQKNSARSLCTENSSLPLVKIPDKHDATDSCSVMEKTSPYLAESGLSKTKCYYCNEEFSSPAHLNNHLKSYHRLSKCDKCGITVLGASKKSNHKLNCSQQRPTKHNDSLLSTENVALVHGQDVSSESCVAVHSVKEVPTDAMNEPHPENIQLKIQNEAQGRSVVYSRPIGNSLANMQNGGDTDGQEIAKDSRMVSVPTLIGRSERQTKKAKRPIVEYPSNQSYTCNICGIASSNYKQLLYHKWVKHKEGKFPCPHCSKKFHHKAVYDTHVPVCAGRKSSCELCGQKFKSNRNVKRHKDRVHRVGEPLKIVNIDCTEEQQQNSVEGVDSEMSSVGDRGKNLALQTRGVKTSSVPHICKICGITSSSIYTAKYHELTKHTEAKHQCPHCPKKYHRNQELKLHVVNCVNRKQSCEMCGQRYKTLFGVKQHMERRHLANGSLRNMTVQGTEGQKIGSEKSSEVKSALQSSSYTKCPHCEKDFSKGVSLPRHIERCHVPSPCNICGVTFANVVKMRYHKGMTHKGLKHKCPHCSKKFPTTKQHRIHLSLCKNKKFSCDLCDTKFKALKYVARHKRIFHQDKKKTNKDQNRRKNSSEKWNQKQTKKIALKRKITLEKTISNIVDVTDGPLCGKNLSNQHVGSGNVETTHQKTSCIKDTCAQQQPSKHDDSQSDAEVNSLLHGENSSSGSYMPVHGVKKVQTDSTNVLQEENIELKMEIEVEDTTLQDQVHHVPNEVQGQSLPTTLVNVIQLADSKDTCAQQQPTKHVDSQSDTVVSSLLHGENSSSGSYMAVHGEKEVATDSTNVPQEENIELKMEIQVEDTKLQGQEYQVPSEDKGQSSPTTLVNVSKLPDIENAIKIKEEFPEEEEESLIEPQLAKQPLEFQRISRDRNESLKRPEADDRLSPCSICRLNFSNKCKLKYHMVVAHTEPSHKCPHCPKMFHFAHRLRRHEKTHGNIVKK